MLFLVVIFFFFRFAFIRTKLLDINNLDSPINKPLLQYRQTIEDGFAFINNASHTRVSTESFDSLRLSARYYENEASERTIILFHGYRSSAERDFSCAVEMYYNMGLNVLLVDQRAHGKSEGKLITFGIKERRDVLSWINWCSENLKETKDIFLGGISMGATTVLLSTALLLPKNIKGIIADCGFTSPIAIMKKVALQIFKFKGTLLLPIMHITCLLIGKFGIYGISTIEALKHNKIPILFVHGKKDNFVPVEMTLEAYAAANCEKQLILVEGADHGLSYLLEPERVEAELQKFISSH